MSTPIIHKDADNLTLTVTTELDATVERAWQLWADPRQLERWWGPPGFPATFVDHDLTPGARISYFMTGPDGDKHRAWWEVIAVEAPTRLEVKDGFADDTGAANDELPVSTMVLTLTERAGRTAMAVETRFPSLEAMDKLVSMGMDEGMAQAMAQIPAILEGSTS